MRGASALGDLLEEAAREDLRTYVVWIPVLDADDGPPSAATAARVPGRRVRQRWDPRLSVAIEAARALPRAAKRPCLQPTGRAEPAEISWDCALLFEPGARWEESLPAPAFFDGPVVYEIDDLRTALDAPTQRD